MNVDDVVAERIAAARARIEAAKRRRTALAAARQRGLAQRHAAKLRNLRGPDGHAAVGQSPMVASVTTTDADDRRPARTSVKDRASSANPEESQ